MLLLHKNQIIFYHHVCANKGVLIVCKRCASMHINPSVIQVLNYSIKNNIFHMILCQSRKSSVVEVVCCCCRVITEEENTGSGCCI